MNPYAAEPIPPRRSADTPPGTVVPARPVGGDGERHPDHIPRLVHQRAARITGVERGGQDEHVATGLVRVVKVPADGLHLLADGSRRYHHIRGATGMPEHGALIVDLGR